jgi:hypothetical protein
MKQVEIHRLNEGPKGVIPSGSFAISFIAHCTGDAPQVLDRCKEVLSIVLQADTEDWPSTDEWRSRLPEWFVERSAEEISQGEAERRLRLPLEERMRLSHQWSVSAFVHWFKPNERYWYWWEAVVKNDDTLQINVIVNDQPFPWGSLDWLLRASGAVFVEEA